MIRLPSNPRVLAQVTPQGALIAQVEFLMPMKKTAKILKQSKAHFDIFRRVRRWLEEGFVRDPMRSVKV